MILVSVTAFASQGRPSRKAATPTPTVTPVLTITPRNGSSSGGEKLSVGKPIPIHSTDRVKVTGAFLVDFWNGPPGVVIEYETKFSMSDMAAVTAEADELMKFFKADIEAAGVGGAVLRASHFEGYGMFREGDGHGFVYSKDTNGVWVREAEKAK
jgi:hypothetical protein